MNVDAPVGKLSYLELCPVENCEVGVDDYIFPVKVVPELLAVPAQHKTQQGTMALIEDLQDLGHRSQSPRA
jgi:hypothetical protein